MKAEAQLRQIYRAFNERAYDALARHFRDDAEIVAPDEVLLQGGNRFADYARAWVVAFPDLQLRMASCVAAGDLVAAEIVAEGTHQGILSLSEGDIAPTGRHVSLRWAEVDRFADGHCASMHVYWDQVELLRQLQALPVLKKVA